MFVVKNIYVICFIKLSIYYIHTPSALAQGFCRSKPHNRYSHQSFPSRTSLTRNLPLKKKQLLMLLWRSEVFSSYLVFLTYYSFCSCLVVIQSCKKSTFELCDTIRLEDYLQLLRVEGSSLAVWCFLLVIQCNPFYQLSFFYYFRFLMFSLSF